MVVAFFVIILVCLIWICCVVVIPNKRSHPIVSKPKYISRLKFMRLTIKSVIRWEQKQGKSFSMMNYNNPEEIESLLYAMYLTETGSSYTFNVFQRAIMDKTFTKQMVSELERITRVMSQFQKKQEKADVGNTDVSPETIASIVSTLIMAGLDAHYALNEMELCDLPLYIEAYEKKRREEMESARMWTYLTILPHIEVRKMKNGAKDLIIFPWEEVEKEAEKEINETEVECFENLLKQGKNIFKS